MNYKKIFKFFNKKQPKIYKKKTTKISFKKEEIDVGVTVIQVEFVDGRKFNHSVYGRVEQFYECGNNETEYRSLFEAVAGEIHITNSRKIAENFLSNIQDKTSVTLVDDPESPNKSEIGLIRRAMILNTHEYKKEVEIAFIDRVAI